MCLSEILNNGIAQPAHLFVHNIISNDIFADFSILEGHRYHFQANLGHQQILSTSKCQQKNVSACMQQCTIPGPKIKLTLFIPKIHLSLDKVFILVCS